MQSTNSPPKQSTKSVAAPHEIGERQSTRRACWWTASPHEPSAARGEPCGRRSACQGQTSSAEARERVSCQVESTCCQSIAPFNCEFVSGACRNVVCIEPQEAVFIGLVTHPLQRMGRGVRRDGSSSALVPRARHRAIVHVWLASIPCAGCGAHGMLCRFCESDT